MSSFAALFLPSPFEKPIVERQSDLSSLTETDYGAISRRAPMRMSAAKSHPRTHARALKAGTPVQLKLF